MGTCEDEIPEHIRLIRRQSNCNLSRLDSAGHWYVSRFNRGILEEFPVPQEVLECAKQRASSGIWPLRGELDVTGGSPKRHARGPAKRS
jgi:hypothetical protein